MSQDPAASASAIVKIRDVAQHKNSRSNQTLKLEHSVMHEEDSEEVKSVIESYLISVRKLAKVYQSKTMRGQRQCA
jgi:uncharacterized protein YsxB (DUF464 family)